MHIPSALRRLAHLPGGEQWLADLPPLVADVATHWGLDLGAPFAGSNVSLVIPAQRREESLVVKLQFPHRESAHEAEALRRWDGEGAVRLLDHDAARHALLLERCDPGHHLSTVDPDDALDVLAGLLPRLWKPSGEPFRSVADEATDWERGLQDSWHRAGRPFDRGLVDEALAAFTHLVPTQGEQVLVHQDLHGDNVLAARREPWLVIDPKPLTAEREFSLAPIIRSRELGHGREAVIGRLDRLTTELDLDRERARLWAFAQTLAWGFEGGRPITSHLEIARWLAHG